MVHHVEKPVFLAPDIDYQLIGNQAIASGHFHRPQDFIRLCRQFSNPAISAGCAGFAPEILFHIFRRPVVGKAIIVHIHRGALFVGRGVGMLAGQHYRLAIGA